MGAKAKLENIKDDVEEMKMRGRRRGLGTEHMNGYRHCARDLYEKYFSKK